METHGKTFGKKVRAVFQKANKVTTKPIALEGVGKGNVSKLSLLATFSKILER